MPISTLFATDLRCYSSGNEGLGLAQGSLKITFKTINHWYGGWSCKKTRLLKTDKMRAKSS